MARAIDADALKAELQNLYQLAGWEKKAIHFSLADMECNIDYMPTVATEPTIYGYDARELMVFAEACRRQGITENDLHDYVLNLELAWKFIMDMVREDSKKALELVLYGEGGKTDG